MDSYGILGVPRNCTREEAKEAFLARVSAAHPDHGGEDLAFIQLRSAYEQILAEIDCRPRVDRLRSERNVKPPGPAIPREAYLAMLARVSGSGRKRWTWAEKLGVTFLLYLAFWFPAVILLVGIVQVFELDMDAYRNLFVYVVNLTALLPACFLVWKSARD